MKVSVKKWILFAAVPVVLLLAAACRSKEYVYYMDGKGTDDLYIVLPQNPTAAENTGAYKIRMAVETGFQKDMSYYFKTDAPEEIVHKYEIIVGETTRLSEEAYPLSKMQMGADGYFIKVIGQKVYIVGGSADALAEAVDYFIAEFIEGRDAIRIAGDYAYVQEAVFDIQGIYVDSRPLAEYQIVYDEEAGAEAADLIGQALIDRAGISLEKAFLEHVEDAGRAIVLSNAALPGDGFIRFAVEEGRLIISCSTEGGLLYGVRLFLETYIQDAKGSFNFPEGFIYSDVGDLVVLMPE